jgi:hypothetical protein
MAKSGLKKKEKKGKGAIAFMARNPVAANLLMFHSYRRRNLDDVQYSERGFSAVSARLC